MGTDERGRRVVDEDVLLAYWRERMEGWPVHQYRLRKQNGDDE